MNRQAVAVVIGALVLVGEIAAQEIKFVTDAFPPYSYAAADSNKAAGPLAEVVSAVCRRIRARCSITVHSLSRAAAMAANGEADAFFPLIRSPTVEDRYRVTEMIVASPISLFAPAPSGFMYRGVHDLDGYTIGVHGPSHVSLIVEALLRSGTGGRAEVDVNNVLVLKKLAAGRYGDPGRGLAAMNRDVARYLMRREGIRGLEEAGVLARIEYGIGFAKRGANAAQFRQFNRALQDLIKSGQVRRILRKYALQAAR